MSNETRRKVLVIALIAIILGTATGRIIDAVTHRAALGFVAVVAIESVAFSSLCLWLRHQRS